MSASRWLRFRSSCRQHAPVLFTSSPLNCRVTHPLDAVILILDLVLAHLCMYLNDFRPEPNTFTSTIHFHRITHIKLLRTDTTFVHPLFSVSICYIWDTMVCGGRRRMGCDGSVEVGDACSVEVDDAWGVMVVWRLAMHGV